MKNRKKSGFTLVELMVVAAIIAILAAIIIPMVTKNKVEAVAAEGKNLAGAIMNSAKAQYARLGEWPTDEDSLDDENLKDDVGDAGWDITTVNDTTVVVTLSDEKNGCDGAVTLAAGVFASTVDEVD